jgi:hypothetical protein
MASELGQSESDAIHVSAATNAIAAEEPTQRASSQVGFSRFAMFEARRYAPLLTPRRRFGSSLFHTPDFSKSASSLVSLPFARHYSHPLSSSLTIFLFQLS